MALTSWTLLSNAIKSKAQNFTLFMKGVGTSEIYAVEVDATTGAIPVSGTFVVTPTPVVGRVAAVRATLGFVASPVSNSAYTQLVASTAGIINELFVAETSGTFMILAVGGAGVEVDTVYMGPGGNTYDVAIAAGSRLSLKNNDITTTATSTGQISITGLT